jgi:hypothetical protein
MNKVSRLRHLGSYSMPNVYLLLSSMYPQSWHMQIFSSLLKLTAVEWHLGQTSKGLTG